MTLRLPSLILLLLLLPILAAAETPRLLVVGDSLSAAFGMAQDQGWVHLLRLRLTNTHPEYEVVNASISGDTTDGALGRLLPALDRHRPGIVIIELGANDGLRGVSLEEIRNNLVSMVKLCQQNGARVLLLGMHLPPNYGPAYTSQFHAVYREVSDRTGSALTPFFLEGIADDMALMQPDGLHPTAEAQGRILSNVWPNLAPLLSPGAGGS